MKTTIGPNSTELHATIKSGIDARAKWFYVGRQLDGATPQLLQKMTFDGLLFRRVQLHIATFPTPPCAGSPSPSIYHPPSG